MKSAIFSLVLLATLVWAHAILVDSDPSPHGVVHGPNAAFRLKFNSRVDASHSRLSVENAHISRAVKIDSQPSPETLVGHVSGLIPGDAVLRWQVLAVDGHITRGELPFNIQ